MPPLSPRSASREWPRRTVLGATGIALAGTLAGCSSGDQEQPAGADDGAASPAPRLPAPDITTTAQWGAMRPKQYLQTLYARPSYVIIHHTSTPNVTDGSAEAAANVAKQIQAAHANGQGWGDSGQHFTVTRGGHVLEARHGSRHSLEGGENFVMGVHAPGFNAYALGIECEGLYMLNPPPQSLYAGLVPLVAFICQQYGLPPSRIIGHRDVTKTSCCGDAFYPKLPMLREDVRISLETGEYHVSEGFGADNLFDDSDVTAASLAQERS